MVGQIDSREMDMSEGNYGATLKEKRSPLKDKPLRNPGQSLDEQIHDLISDYIVGPMVFALFLVLVAVLEWLKYLGSIPPKPLLYSVPAALAIGYALFRFFPVRRKFKALQLGRDGEKAVGQFLDSLREQGYRVFHDVLGERFNIDHVLIGPAGVFTIETKTHSKPASREAYVVFDGEAISVDGYTPDRDPIVQAKAEASWVRELLSESTGRKFEVRPVIVYPGWFIKYSGPKTNTMWVLEPKGLPTFLQHEPVRLKPEDIQLASFHLSRFVRTSY